MPAWNPRQDWLKVAIASALDQRGVRTELIVVDDGSEKPVSDQLQRLGEEQLQVKRTEHRGHAAATNTGIELARGDYIRFIDADDALPPDSTANLLALTAGRQDVLAYGATLVCDEALRPLWRMRPRQQGDVVLDSLLARFNVRPGGLLWPREVVRRTGHWDIVMKTSSDWEYIQRAVEHATVRGTPAVVHFYRRHGSALTTDFEAGRASARQIIERYFDRHPDQRGTRLERRARAMLDATSARVYATHGKPVRAAVHLARGLRRDPLCLANEFAQARGAILGKLERRLRN